MSAIACLRQSSWEYPNFGIHSAQMKKHWFALATTVVLLVAAGFVLYPRFAQRAEQKRQAEYQHITESYSDALRQGMSRAEVEAYIRSRKQTFTQMCCVGAIRNAWADLIKIGEAKSPTLKWPCTGTNIYVAFEFDASEPPSTPKATDSDRLLSVTLFQQPQPCL